MIENSPSKQDLLGSNLGRAHFSFSSFFFLFNFCYCSFVFILYYVYLYIFYSLKPSFHFFLLLAVSLPLAPSAVRGPRGSAIHVFLVL